MGRAADTVEFPPEDRYVIIEETWKRLERRLRIDGVGEPAIANARSCFVASLYATAAAMTVERYDATDVSQMAFRIEMQK